MQISVSAETYFNFRAKLVAILIVSKCTCRFLLHELLYSGRVRRLKFASRYRLVEFVVTLAVYSRERMNRATNPMKMNRTRVSAIRIYVLTTSREKERETERTRDRYGSWSFIDWSVLKKMSIGNTTCSRSNINFPLYLCLINALLRVGSRNKNNTRAQISAQGLVPKCELMID